MNFKKLFEDIILDEGKNVSIASTIYKNNEEISKKFFNIKLDISNASTDVVDFINKTDDKNDKSKLDNNKSIYDELVYDVDKLIKKLDKIGTSLLGLSKKNKNYYGIKNKIIIGDKMGNFKDIFEGALDINKDIYEMGISVKILNANIIIIQNLLKRNKEHFPKHKELNEHLNTMLKELNYFLKKTSYG